MKCCALKPQLHLMKNKSVKLSWPVSDPLKGQKVCLHVFILTLHLAGQRYPKTTLKYLPFVLTEDSC